MATQTTLASVLTTGRCIEELARSQEADAEDDRSFSGRQDVSVFFGRHAALLRYGVGIYSQWRCRL